MTYMAVFPIAVAMLAASCSAGTTDTTTSPAEAATTTVAAIATTTDPAATSTVEQTATTTVASEPGGATVNRDIVYLELNGHEYLVDVYVPAGEGPWPVVVALHGAPVYKDNGQTTMVAQAAAEAGMLVFAPNWTSPWSGLSAMDAEWIRTDSEPALDCALAFAQQEAVGYGGDSTRTVIQGTSAGASSGAPLVLRPAADPAAGCVAQTPSTAPVGAVFGDAEYFYHNAFWDGAFDEDIDEMQAIVAESVDPAAWTTELPARVRLWAAAEGSFARSFDDPWDEAGWFALRDPDGSIREDLDELGELDDGAISYIDEGFLFAYRLQQAGVDVTFDILPGGHSATDKVPELVAYLLDAAGVS